MPPGEQGTRATGGLAFLHHWLVTPVGWLGARTARSPGNLRCSNRAACPREAGGQADGPCLRPRGGALTLPPPRRPPSRPSPGGLVVPHGRLLPTGLV